VRQSIGPLHFFADRVASRVSQLRLDLPVNVC